MKAKVLSVMLLICLSVVVVGQTKETGLFKVMPDHKQMQMNQGPMGPMMGLGLTDVQKEAFKKSMMAVQKQIQPLKGELGEAEAHQKTLMTAEKPDMGAIDKNIEKIASIRVQIAKIMVKHQMEMRSQLTDEQRLKFDLMKGKMGKDKGMRGKIGKAKGMKGRMGMRPGMNGRMGMHPGMNGNKNSDLMPGMPGMN
ncbi:MAG: Spy/CpxP family protein refolding chaperone [Mariniphaga sp.]